MYSICFADLSQFLLDEVILRRLEVGGVDNFDTGDTERPEEPDVDDYVNQPKCDRMVTINRKRLAELLDAHSMMEFYRDAKVTGWTWYGASVEADPKADNLLDRLEIDEIEEMLEREAEKGTLTPDWYPDEPVTEPTPVVPLPERLTFDPPAIKAPDVNGPPGAEEGETCRRDKCDGKMVYESGKCGCNHPNASPPCSYCVDGPYCDSCGCGRNDDNQPTQKLPPKGKWWLVFDPKRGDIIGVNGYGRFFRERETAVHAAERFALDTREICFVVEADCMIVPPKQSCTVKKI